MTLNAAIEAQLPFLRAEAEAAMSDTFAATGKPTWTTVDGIETQTRPDMGSTVGRVAGSSSQARDTNTRTVTIGGTERPVVEGGLHIPVSAPVPEIGWRYTCTALGPSSDPSLLNRVWEVVDVPAKSHATARRLDVVQIPQEA